MRSIKRCVCTENVLIFNLLDALNIKVFTLKFLSEKWLKQGTLIEYGLAYELVFWQAHLGWNRMPKMLPSATQMGTRHRCRFEFKVLHLSSYSVCRIPSSIKYVILINYSISFIMVSIQ